MNPGMGFTPRAETAGSRRPSPRYHILKQKADRLSVLLKEVEEAEADAAAQQSGALEDAATIAGMAESPHKKLKQKVLRVALMKANACAKEAQAFRQRHDASQKEFKEEARLATLPLYDTVVANKALRVKKKRNALPEAAQSELEAQHRDVALKKTVEQFTIEQQEGSMKLADGESEVPSTSTRNEPEPQKSVDLSAFFKSQILRSSIIAASVKAKGGAARSLRQARESKWKAVKNLKQADTDIAEAETQAEVHEEAIAQLQLQVHREPEGATKLLKMKTLITMRRKAEEQEAALAAIQEEKAQAERQIEASEAVVEAAGAATLTTLATVENQREEGSNMAEMLTEEATAIQAAARDIEEQVKVERDSVAEQTEKLAKLPAGPAKILKAKALQVNLQKVEAKEKKAATLQKQVSELQEQAAEAIIPPESFLGKSARDVSTGARKERLAKWKTVNDHRANGRQLEEMAAEAVAEQQTVMEEEAKLEQMGEGLAKSLKMKALQAALNKANSKAKEAIALKKVQQEEEVVQPARSTNSLSSPSSVRRRASSLFKRKALKKMRETAQRLQAEVEEAETLAKDQQNAVARDVAQLEKMPAGPAKVLKMKVIKLSNARAKELAKAAEILEADHQAEKTKIALAEEEQGIVLPSPLPSLSSTESDPPRKRAPLGATATLKLFLAKELVEEEPFEQENDAGIEPDAAGLTARAVRSVRQARMDKWKAVKATKEKLQAKVEAEEQTKRIQGLVIAWRERGLYRALAAQGRSDLAVLSLQETELGKEHGAAAEAQERFGCLNQVETEEAFKGIIEASLNKAVAKITARIRAIKERQRFFFLKDFVYVDAGSVVQGALRGCAVRTTVTEARKSSRWALGFFVDVALEKNSLIPYTVPGWEPTSAPDLYILTALLSRHKDKLNNSPRACTYNTRFRRPATPPRKRFAGLSHTRPGSFQARKPN